MYNVSANFGYMFSIIRPHRYTQHKMRPIVANVAWSVCMRSCLVMTIVIPAKRGAVLCGGN